MGAILGIRCCAEWPLAKRWAELGLGEEYHEEKSGLYSGN